MKNLIKAILTMVILTVMFIKVYTPLMTSNQNSTTNANAVSNLENFYRTGN